MIRHIASVYRLFTIGRVLARHGALTMLSSYFRLPIPLRLAQVVFGRRVEGEPGEKLARAFIKLGPSFIKLGQFLATRPDLLGDDVATDLAMLQDRLPPFPTENARRILENELGESLETVFETFEEEPYSAASIAQVHFAVIRKDHPSAMLDTLSEPDPTPYEIPKLPREVAIKILRPGIEAAFDKDLDLMFWLAEGVEKRFPSFRRFRPRELVTLFAETVQREMDLRLEAAAASELKENFRDAPFYHIPVVNWQLTRRRVLVMERVDYIRIDDRKALIAAGHDIADVLTKASTIFFQQVFRDGYFHGDQHPGNMGVEKSGRIVAVDFGIMGRLDQSTRAYLADMLLATLARDYRRLADVHLEAGYLTPDHPRDEFAQALRAVCEPIFGQPLSRISFGRLLGQLIRLTESYDMPVQPQLVLMQKNMLIAEGVSRKLDKDLNIWLLAEPLIRDWIYENRGPKARITATLGDMALVMERLPKTLLKLEAFLDRYEVEGPANSYDTAASRRKGKQDRSTQDRSKQDRGKRGRGKRNWGKDGRQ